MEEEFEQSDGEYGKSEKDSLEKASVEKIEIFNNMLIEEHIKVRCRLFRVLSLLIIWGIQKSESIL